MSAPVQRVVDGEGAYLRAWSRSGTVRRLRHNRLVQVARRTVFGVQLRAAARPLVGEQANQADGKLAGKYPVQQRFLIRLPRRTRRWQMTYYELL